MNLRSERLWVPIKDKDCEYCGGALKAEVLQFRTLGGVNRTWSGEIRCRNCGRAYDMDTDDLIVRYGEP